MKSLRMVSALASTLLLITGGTLLSVHSAAIAKQQDQQTPVEAKEKPTTYVLTVEIKDVLTEEIFVRSDEPYHVALNTEKERWTNSGEVHVNRDGSSTIKLRLAKEVKKPDLKGRERIFMHGFTVARRLPSDGQKHRLVIPEAALTSWNIRQVWVSIQKKDFSEGTSFATEVKTIK